MGRVLIITSPNSVSLQKVSNDIARVFNERKDELGITKADVSLARVAKPSTYKDVDLAIVVMTFDPTYIRGYAFIPWLLRQRGKNAVLYTTTEGKVLHAQGDEWIARDLTAIANSQYTAERLAEYGMKTDGIIYHGVDVEKIQSLSESRQTIRENLGFSEDDFVVGYIAGCYNRKGHDKFGQAIQEVTKRDPTIKFVILTQPKCVEYYGGNENVITIPKFGLLDEEEVHQLYHAFDLYAQASLSEGFGIPVLEALSAGVPVVHADYKPLTEITDEITSFRVPVRERKFIRETGSIKYELHLYNPHEFAEAIINAKEAVLSDREGYREKAIERARQFDMHKVYNSFIEIYKHGRIQDVI